MMIAAEKQTIRDRKPLYGRQLVSRKTLDQVIEEEKTYSILWRFRAKKEKWANNIAGTIGDEHHGTHGCLLGVACDVG